jgi:nitric oxide synthase-interacting protein
VSIGIYFLINIRQCTKSLHNGMKLVVVKTCGHVVCAPCVKKFKIASEGKCAVCDVACKGRELIELHGEGTGFVQAGGQNVSSTYTHAFQ